VDIIGRSLGKYQVLEEIGRGGMGAVYKGYDPALKRPVAIKVMAPHLMWEKRFVDRFMREARTVARLRHPHIVTIHDVGEQDGLYYLVMAFIEGESLGRVVAREGRLAPERATRLLGQIAAALDYAHSQGIVHRDVKPANILLEAGSRVVLTDFGIAHATDETRLTATGATLGTPAYMSPEQARGQPPDALSDVYSLGIVLYEMLTGHTPFRAETPLAVLHMQASAAPTTPRRFAPSLSPAVEAVVLRALSKDPTSRYASAGDLARAMTEALAGGEPPIRAGDPPRALQPSRVTDELPNAVAEAAPPSRRLTWLWVLLAIVTIALVVAGVRVALPSSQGGELPTTPPAPSPTAQVVAVATTHSPPTAPAATLVASNIYIEYVLGASNSMMQPLGGGQTKLDAACSALAQHWGEMRTQPNAGLRAYGHRLSGANEDSCLDTELMVPIAEGHLDQMAELLRDISARGMAPLSQALIEASKDFAFTPGRANALLLIADGGDSCDANPCQTAKAHREVGIGYPIYVVGLAPDEQARQQLMCVATSSGGVYRDAASEAELLLALDAFLDDIAASAP
jgi:serine/threonine-protein kinase